MPRSTVRHTAAAERIALAGSAVFGIGASVWVLMSRRLADFLGEGPVRLLSLGDGTQQATIAIGTLLATAVYTAIAWSRPSPWRYAAGGVALLVSLALAPPLILPAAGLYLTACALAVASGLSTERRATLAPRRHPVVWAGGGVLACAGLVLIAAVSVWLLRPLFDDGKRLDEALAFDLPVAAAPTESGSDGAGAGAVAPVDGAQTVAAGATGSVLASGQLEGKDSFHFASGDVRLLRGPDGQLVLRFEDHEVRNGPDLFVYLSPDAGGDPEVDGALNLGGIKATKGNVNYDVPPDVDTSQFRSAVIWCRSFRVVFAVARLE